MMEMPPLTESELSQLRASIERDGVKYPILLDRSGNLVDGFHRQKITADLGIPCPTETLDVDEETADRLRITLNLARRQLSRLDRSEMIAWLAAKYETEAKAEAKERIRKHGGTAPGTPSAGQAQGVRANDVIAERINEDLAKMGETMRVTRNIVEKSRAVSRLPEETKRKIREGKTSVDREVFHPGTGRKRASKTSKPVNNGSAGARPAKREVPEHVVAQARIRASDAELKYQSMLNAPEGKLNIPLLDRASKIQEILLEVTGLTPEQAVSGIPAMRCREYSPEMARWWLRFAELCDERRRTETPDLPTLYKRPRSASLNPVVVGGPIAPDCMSPATRAVYDWIAKQTDPVTVVEAAVAAKINRTTAGDALRKLVQTGHVELVGSVDGRGNALNLYGLKVEGVPDSPQT